MSANGLKTPFALAFTLIAVALAPAAAAAQSELDTSQAEGFMGSWEISINSDYGLFTLDLDIVDQGGKVAATIGSPDMGGDQEVTDISRDGEQLVLRYEAEAEGQMFPVVVELTPDGADLSVGFDAADGMFFARGTATRADG